GLAGYWIRHGQNGLVVRGDDERDMASAVVWLIRHPAARERLGRAAREDAVAGFSADSIVQRYVDLYAQLIPPAALPEIACGSSTCPKPGAVHSVEAARELPSRARPDCSIWVSPTRSAAAKRAVFAFSIPNRPSASCRRCTRAIPTMRRTTRPAARAAVPS